MGGTGAPVCPRCHAGPVTLEVPRPRRSHPGWSGHVPDHPDWIAWRTQVTGRLDEWRLLRATEKIPPSQAGRGDEILLEDSVFYLIESTLRTQDGYRIFLKGRNSAYVPARSRIRVRVRISGESR